MASRNNKISIKKLENFLKKNKHNKWIMGLAAVVMLGAIIVTAGEALNIDAIPSWTTVLETADTVLYGETSETTSDLKEIPEGDTVTVTVLDVGQGDSILIRTPEQNVLIDASLPEEGDNVVKHLKDEGINNLDLVIMTHPHADHIGGMQKVFDNITVDKVIMSPQSHTTNMYKKLLTTIKTKKIASSTAKPGTVLELGGGATLTILGPVQKFDDLNDASVISKLQYGETGFLFSGDAEKTAEEALLAKNPNLDVDVMVAGHHGSRTSTSGKYFAAASPEFIAISCGKDNDYGHPHKETLERIKDCTVNRTDLEGDITYVSDGNEIYVTTEN
ncbi:MAG: MBL fold metallo-hydrolase [Oscillospiraceae bacterium]